MQPKCQKPMFMVFYTYGVALTAFAAITVLQTPPIETFQLLFLQKSPASIILIDKIYQRGAY